MSLKHAILYRSRDWYWESRPAQSLYSAMELKRAHSAETRGDLYLALQRYAGSARRVRNEKLRRRRLDEFAAFIDRAFGNGMPATLEENPFIRAFLESKEADAIRAMLRTMPAEKRANLAADVIVLKKQSGEEKGVLLVKYTPHFKTFLCNYRFAEMAERYSLVLEPSWYLYPAEFWAMFCNQKTIVASQTFSEEIATAMQNARLPIVTVPIGPQDWVDPDIFKPLQGVKKEFDLVMIASFQRLKRHALLFRALQQIRPRRLKVALIGQTWERNRAEFDKEIEAFDMKQDCTIYQGLTAAQVNEVLNRSKVKVLLSKMEGGNRSVIEATAANVPCIVYKHLIGRRDVHPETGVYVEDHELPRVLLETIDNYERFQPREWLLRNTGTRNSTTKLNDALRAETLRRGKPWTRDIVAKVNHRIALKYLDPENEERFHDVTEELGNFVTAL